jgi:dihydrofolate reductase
MGNVIVALAISLDGFIAGRDDSAEQPLGTGGQRLFDWYFDGDLPVRRYAEAGMRGIPVPPFKLKAPNAKVFDDLIEAGGAIVTGRRTYDLSGGFGGNGPVPGPPVFVVTHLVPDEVPKGEAEYFFITDGVPSAIEKAKAAAGDKNVSLMGASVTQQCLREGLLDEIVLHVVPVLLGGGVRLLDQIGPDPVQLEIKDIIDGPGVTHLRYRVVR